MSHRAPLVQKPKALREGARIGVVSPSSPAERQEVLAGVAELTNLGFRVEISFNHTPDGYFASKNEERLLEFCKTVHNKNIDGVIAARGGYGANYLIEGKLATRLKGPKAIVGFSDLTAIQTLLWQVRGWVTFYGPMVAAGFNRGADQPHGYDKASFLEAVRNEKKGWGTPLRGESISSGEAVGRLLGGCLTLLQTTLGTDWEIDTRGAILILEDRGMKPYQVDRALMHLRHAGKFEQVRGIILGDFPDCEAPVPGGPTVHEACERILAPLKLPILYGAPVGHTKRAMLTLPLGVRARLVAEGEGQIEVLEAAVAG